MRGHARWKALREIVVGGVSAVVTVIASPLLRRWYNRWGTTDENLVGCNIHSVDRILPEHQNLAVGDIVRSGKDQHICWVVMDLDPPHHLILQGAGTPANVAVPDVVDEVPDRGYAASTGSGCSNPSPAVATHG